ncbi:hypothetical protein K2X30_10860 [bacterium]|nr:hypothetical protein [bacterium]
MATSDLVKRLRSYVNSQFPIVALGTLFLGYVFFIACYGLTRNSETLGGDEFLYLLWAQHPNEAAFMKGMSEAHSIVHFFVYRLLGWANADIVTFRLLKLAAVIASSIFLTLGFWSWIKERKNLYRHSVLMNLPVLLFTLGIGSFFTYSFDLPGLSYNSLTSFFLLSAGGLLLLGLSKPQRVGLLLISGFFAGFGFFSKVPSGIIFLGLAGVAVLFHKSQLKSAGYFFGGVLLALVSYFLFIQDLPTWTSHIAEGSRNIVMAMPDYQPGSRLVTYFLDFLRAIGVAFFYFSPVYYGIYLLTKNLLGPANRRMQKTSVVLIAGGVVGIFTIEYLLLRKYLPGRVFDSWTRPFLILIATLLALLAAVPKKNLLTSIRTSNRMEIYAVLTFLFFLPFAGSFGTAVNIMGHITIGLAPWFALIWLLACLVGQYLLVEAGIAAISVTWVLVSAQLTVDSFKSDAYALTAHTLNFSTNPWLSRMKFTPERLKVLEQVQDGLKRAGVKKGDPLIEWGAVMPIYVYMMGGISPGNPYYARREQQMCVSLKNSELKNLSSSYLLLSTWSGNPHLVSPYVQDCWKAVGIDFPKNYRLVAKVPATSCCNGEASTLSIYAPK